MKNNNKIQNKKRFRMISLMLVLIMILSLAGCGKDKGQTTEKDTEQKTEQASKEESTTAEEAEDTGYKYLKYKDMTADEIVAELTLDQKAAQMVMAQLASIDASQMEDHCYGAVMSRIDPLDENYEDWQEIVEEYQRAAVESDAGIPIIYGNDDVHGVNFAVDTVLFPHNIGLGAANDKELMYEIGQITGDEAMLCHMIWNYAPCVAQSEDPRWGRTYESYGSDLEIIKSLSTEYTKGLVDAGMIACPKHFFGDGNVEYGSGEKTMLDMLIDRGDAELSNDEIDELLSVYQAQVDAGAQSIMASHSSVNGVKMHENGEYLQYLKDEMGFNGFVSGDWNSVQNTSGSSYYDQVVNSVNAGIDMFMEVDEYETVRQYIVEAVGKGDISEERVDDAARRIIQVKLDAGVFEDPFFENLKTKQTETGSTEYRAVAEKAVEESLVLLKNDDDILPFKSGTKVYITGPASNSAQVQCGGWSLGWNSSPENDIAGATTILEGFEEKASEYGIELITNKSNADEADVVLLVVGEQPYAEWNGDTEDMELCGSLGLIGNERAISEVKDLGKPIVTCIVAGRQVIMNDYYGEWDGVVMCYLPGTEGQGVADVLCGGTDFKGKLPSPWYSSTDQIGTGTSWLETGYGLTYKDGGSSPDTDKDSSDNSSSDKEESDKSGSGSSGSGKSSSSNTAFWMDGNLLRIDDSILSMSYTELNDYVGGDLPDLISWEYSSEPLDYCDYKYKDGKIYVLYFKNNELIGVRAEVTISKHEVPDSYLNAANDSFGDYYFYWYDDNNVNIEYDWNNAGAGSKEYAVFLNPYDDIEHLDMQYTSKSYSGTIQNH